MNEEKLKTYKMYYQYALMSILIAEFIPMLGVAIDMSFFGTIQLVFIGMLILYTSKINKIPKFPNQKPITLLVIIWCSLLVLGTIHLIYLLSSNMNYLMDDGINILDFLITTASLILTIWISIRCYQNIKVLKKVEIGEITRNSVEL